MTLTPTVGSTQRPPVATSTGSSVPWVCWSRKGDAVVPRARCQPPRLRLSRALSCPVSRKPQVRQAGGWTTQVPRSGAWRAGPAPRTARGHAPAGAPGFPWAPGRAGPQQAFTGLVGACPCLPRSPVPPAQLPRLPPCAQLQGRHTGSTRSRNKYGTVHSASQRAASRAGSWTREGPQS